jgi:hypothetical protein
MQTGRHARRKASVVLIPRCGPRCRPFPPRVRRDDVFVLEQTILPALRHHAGRPASGHPHRSKTHVQGAPARTLSLGRVSNRFIRKFPFTAIFAIAARTQAACPRIANYRPRLNPPDALPVPCCVPLSLSFEFVYFFATDGAFSGFLRPRPCHSHRPCTGFRPARGLASVSHPSMPRK